MGNVSAKFKKHIQKGDEYAALQIYYNNPDLRKSLDPNLSFGEHHHNYTAVHYATKHGMKHILRLLLNDLNGNPNKRNIFNESALHVICMASSEKSSMSVERKLDCLGLILQWRGSTITDALELERIDLSAFDKNGNTALHCAAAAGFQDIVEILVNHGAPLFAENGERQTAGDVASKCRHDSLALYLESKMVFIEAVEETMERDGDRWDGSGSDTEGSYSGLKTQDLQEAKDQLLVETADMLHIPLFTAEALLKDHEWSKEQLLEDWFRDAADCCERSGVKAPASASPSVSASEILFDYEKAGSSSCQQTKLDSFIVECEICCETKSGECIMDSPCGHKFCSSCWRFYILGKVKEVDSAITCPGYNCQIKVPPDIIESLLPHEILGKYSEHDIIAFVETNPEMKWCPIPGCSRAVRIAAKKNLKLRERRGSGDHQLSISHAVDCGVGHFFCWECGVEAHAPSSCENWVAWQARVGQLRPEDMSTTTTETEVAANSVWLVTHCKPCPHCKSPIQKNEGCNHIKCSKCKHDFCWLCLESWKKHSSATGGYFRCNRYEAVSKADEQQGILISEVTYQSERLNELSRFLHYYSRYANHNHSRQLEEPLLHNARQKIELMASVGLTGNQEKDYSKFRFIEDCLWELIKSRWLLSGSYIYAFYLRDKTKYKATFERLQSELESCTESLSGLVARPVLRASKRSIVQAAVKLRRKRHELLYAVERASLGTKKKFTQQEYDNALRSVNSSIRALSPANPWILDRRRPSMFSANLVWPPEEDEEDSEFGSETLLSRINIAKNSLSTSAGNFTLDLLMALELSQLESLRSSKSETEGLQVGGPSSSNVLPNIEFTDGDATEDIEDAQMRLAIELSVEDFAKNISKTYSQEAPTEEMIEEEQDTPSPAKYWEVRDTAEVEVFYECSEIQPSSSQFCDAPSIFVDGASTSKASEVEPETGIPKSPTLVISGVTINRSTESSLPRHCNFPPLDTIHSDFCKKAKKRRANKHLLSVPNLTLVNSLSPLPSPKALPNSACELRGDTEAFPFPSVKGGDLSSVLLVQEQNLRDGFHESLFLPNSPTPSCSRAKSCREGKKHK